MKSGFITIAGRPNAGKSTLLNALVGEKVSIVSPKPQTTRNKITGVMHGEGFQAVFIDTPGILNAKNRLSQFMQKNIEGAFSDVDAVMYVIAADKNIAQEDYEYITRLGKSSKRLLVILNKCETPKGKVEVPVKIAMLANIEGVDAIIPVSAKTGKNLDMLKKEIIARLSEGEEYFPEDMVTDRSVKFMSAEIIREKSLLYLSEEIPYGIGVDIEKFEEKERVTIIDAVIVCDKEAHKPIIIGKGGAMLKKISAAARVDIERLLDKKTFLSVFVKVKEGWRDNQVVLNGLGYGKNDV